MWVGAAGERGFEWKPVGLLRSVYTSGWCFWRFPPMKAEFIHVRFLRTHGQSAFGVSRLRVYDDDGPGAMTLSEIADPKPPTGEAGELEKRASLVLIEEEGGARYREAKVLKKSAEKVIVITTDGKKVTVDPSQAHPFEPIDFVKLELGDDVLVPEPNAKATYVRVTVTEKSKDGVRVQLGAREFQASSEHIFQVPPAKQ
jgi:hypothetical protein